MLPSRTFRLIKHLEPSSVTKRLSNFDHYAQSTISESFSLTEDALDVRIPFSFSSCVMIKLSSSVRDIRQDIFQTQGRDSIKRLLSNAANFSRIFAVLKMALWRRACEKAYQEQIEFSLVFRKIRMSQNNICAIYECRRVTAIEQQIISLEIWNPLGQIVKTSFSRQFSL